MFAGTMKIWFALLGACAATALAAAPALPNDPVHKVMGNVAILGGVVELKGTDEGQSFSQRIRFSDVWHKRQGHWQVIYIQVTRLPNP
jgi:ketosteroid isomerase-like protein